MDNLTIYNEVRNVPDSAKRRIEAGRLKGKTDINPMWRIKALTEKFGPCGIGWKYVITDKRLEQGANGEIAAFLDIDLFVKADGVWSDAIPGTGGSAFVAKEKNGPYTSDECFKMALTVSLWLVRRLALARTCTGRRIGASMTSRRASRRLRCCVSAADCPSRR